MQFILIANVLVANLTPMTLLEGIYTRQGMLVLWDNAELLSSFDVFHIYQLSQHKLLLKTQTGKIHKNAKPSMHKTLIMPFGLLCQFYTNTE